MRRQFARWLHLWRTAGTFVNPDNPPLLTRIHWTPDTPARISRLNCKQCNPTPSGSEQSSSLLMFELNGRTFLNWEYIFDFVQIWFIYLGLFKQQDVFPDSPLYCFEWNLKIVFSTKSKFQKKRWVGREHHLYPLLSNDLLTAAPLPAEQEETQKMFPKNL